MKRTEEYFREIIKKDVEAFTNKVINKVALEVLQHFIRRTMVLEADLSDLPPVKQKEYEKFAWTARFQFGCESLFKDDISDMIREEISVFMSKPDSKPKPSKGAKSGKS